MYAAKPWNVTLRKKDLDCPFYLVPLGDIHLLNEACAKDRAQETIDWIKRQERCLWIGMGDYCDFIGYKDSRFDPTVVDKMLRVSDLGAMGQKGNDTIAEWFAPIADKCMGLLYGNHEDAYQLHQEQQHLHRELCDRLKVQNLGYSCFASIVFKRGKKTDTFTIRAHHGSGYAQTRGGKMQRLKKFVDQTNADITLMGHLHDKLVYPDIQLVPQDGKIVERERLGVMTGSYLATYAEGTTTYAEKRGYDPVPLGSPRIPLQPFNRQRFGVVETR